MRYRLLPFSILMSALTLGGCSWFSDIGEHFPVIGGQRCEYWQCFTESGRQQSDAIRQSKERAAQGDAAGTTPSGAAPAGSAATPQAAPPSHVEFIDPDKVEPVDPSSLSSPW